MTLVQFFLVACGDSDKQNSNLTKDAGTAQFVNQLVEEGGVSSGGGGGFDDQYALETLNLAKAALSQIIFNSSDNLYESFPEGKRRLWLSNLIKETQFKNIEEFKYEGRPIKFNYNLETEELYATKFFVDRFPFGRMETRNDIDKARVMIELFLDLLHEASHFYGVGVSEKTNINSSAWAMHFVTHILSEQWICLEVDEDRLIQIHPNTGLYSSEYTGLETLEEAVIKVKTSGSSLALFGDSPDQIETFNSNKYFVLNEVYRSLARSLGQAYVPELYRYSFYRENFSYDEGFNAVKSEDSPIVFSALGNIDRNVSTDYFELSENLTGESRYQIENSENYLKYNVTYSLKILKDTGRAVYEQTFTPEDTVGTPDADELAQAQEEIKNYSTKKELMCEYIDKSFDLQSFISDEPIDYLMLEWKKVLEDEESL